LLLLLPLCPNLLLKTPDNDGNPRRTNTFFYLSNVTNALTDTAGRPWPGNSAEAEGLLFTRCQEPRKELIVRMIDTCPCKQVCTCCMLLCHLK
jgi:hypothetical protein